MLSSRNLPCHPIGLPCSAHAWLRKHAVHLCLGAAILFLATSVGAQAPPFSGKVKIDLLAPTTVPSYFCQQPFYVDVQIDMGSASGHCSKGGQDVKLPAVLGGFTVPIRFEPAMVRYDSVQACPSAPPQFASPPTSTDAKQAQSAGEVRITSAQMDADGPVGSFCVARLKFFVKEGVTDGQTRMEPFCDDLSSSKKPNCPGSPGTLRGTCGRATIHVVPCIVTTGSTLVEGHTRHAQQVELALHESSAHAISMHFRTEDGSASAGTDFESARGSVVFPPGTIERSVDITILGNSQTQPNRGFRLRLGEATQTPSEEDQAVPVEILDDDGLPALSAVAIRVHEGQSGGHFAQIPVRLAPAAASAVSVRFDTSMGSATPGNDFEPASGTLTFAAGESERLLPVRILDDALGEPSETFLVLLSEPEGAVIGQGAASVTISDTDALPPTLLQVEPNAGKTAGGTQVLLRGSGFQPGVSVRFDGAVASVLTVFPDTLFVVAPAHSPGGAAVHVTNPDGQAASLAYAFNYYGY